MKNWLDKYEQGGMVLKQKTKDNYGEKPNPNNPDVSLPPGFKGWAYNTKGRNYSPAWGGQFQNGGNLMPAMAGANQTVPMMQMGGSLPGATGMMYARTINPAPSNGPYAKKTKASAQNGKKLSYNQWKKQHNLKETPDYNLKRAWELGYTPDKTGHLPTVDNQTGQFLKAKGHPTLQLELDWYNSPEGADFRNKNMIDSSGKFFKYVPKSQNGMEMKFYQEGLDWKPKNISRDGSVIPQAQVGTMVTPLDFTKELGTLEGVSDVLSAPARTATYLLTGKYQDPSQALGIKNPWGALAADMVLDPVNLIGAGIAGKAAKASTKTGALSKAYKYNPWAFKPDPEAGYRMIGGKEGLIDAVRSGEIRPTSQYEHAHFNIGQPLNPNRLSAEELIQAGNPGGYKGPYMAEMKQGTWQRMTDAFSNNPEMQEQLKLLGKDKDVWQHPLFGNIKLNDPRLKLYKEHWLKGYKEVKPKKKEEGGEIKKDDMGYWNPENWGEPVEIGSNEITMQGVYEPLLGISDTGDTQMMYPGEDYTFDGESVTEYPIMQKGGRVPIYVDNPNDPRLKAYQDSLAAYKTNIWPEHNEPIKKYSVPKETYKIVGKDKDGKDVWGLRPYKPTNMEPAYQYDYIDNSQVGKESIFEKIGKTKAGNFATMLLYKKPVQPVEYRKPKGDQFGLTREDYIQAQKSKFVRTPDSKLGDGYYDFKKDGKSYKVYTQSGGINWVDVPQQKSKQVVKPELKKEEPVKKTEQPKPVEKKQNVYEGTPVYSPGAGSGRPSALVGFLNQKGDTTFIKPEDYERFAVPKYGKEFIESKKKQRNGGVNKADEYPIEKLDQLLNFTNYNKPTKGGWLDKWAD